jgi:hypothetical protein
MNRLSLICLFAIWLISVEGKGDMRWSKLVCDKRKRKMINDYIDDSLIVLISYNFEINERPDCHDDILYKMPAILKNKTDIDERINNAVCRLKRGHYIDKINNKLYWSNLICETSKIKPMNDYTDNNILNLIYYMFNTNENDDTMVSLLNKMSAFLKTKPDMFERLNNAVCRLKRVFYNNNIYIIEKIYNNPNYKKKDEKIDF